MAFRKKTIEDIDVAGKTILVRVAYNVPTRDGVVAEDMRIRASLPTIKYLLEHGAEKIVLISHLGRPEGEVKQEFSLKPVANRLGELLPETNVSFLKATAGPAVKAFVEFLKPGGVLLLENLRFSPLEEKNDEKFADEIIAATGAEIFVQDGFAVIHRAHTSTDAVARRLPAVAGFLVADEVEKLERAISTPEHPVLVIIGGAKVEDKQPMIEQFLPIADDVVVGGKIAADAAYVANNEKIYIADDFKLDASGAKLDIGEISTAKIIEKVKGAKTIIWNGTLGMVEDPRFEGASREVARAMGARPDVLTIVGGGDTAGYVEKLLREELKLEFSLISTGGGASLELLSGKKLPGLEILQDK